MQLTRTAKFLVILVILFSITAPLSFVSAQNTNKTPKPATNANSNTNLNLNAQGQVKTGKDADIAPIDNSTGASSLEDLVIKVIKILFLLIIIAAVVVIVVAGFRMVTGGNNPDQLVKAKKTIVWAIIGLIVAFMSYSIVEIIANLLK